MGLSPPTQPSPSLLVPAVPKAEGTTQSRWGLGSLQRIWDPKGSLPDMVKGHSCDRSGARAGGGRRGRALQEKPPSLI